MYAFDTLWQNHLFQCGIHNPILHSIAYDTGLWMFPAMKYLPMQTSQKFWELDTKKNSYRGSNTLGTA